MMSAPERLARSKQSIEPQVIRTIGSGLLAAFVVVLIVSVTTIGWHGTEAYVHVMVTLVLSLLVLMAATLLTGWLLARMQSQTAGDTSPSSELKRLRDEVVTQHEALVKLLAVAAEAEPTRRPEP